MAESDAPDPHALLAALEQMDLDLVEFGWDQPGQVALLFPTPGQPGQVSLVATETTQVAPQWRLVGSNAPARALGVAVSFELWANPQEVLDTLGDLADATEHPRRRELRQIVLVTRAGQLATLTRERAEDDGPDHVQACLVQGTCDEYVSPYLRGVLRRYLGGDSDVAVPSARTLLGLYWLSYLEAYAARRLAASDPSDNQPVCVDAELTHLRTQPLPMLLRGALDLAEPEELPEVLRLPRDLPAASPDPVWAALVEQLEPSVTGGLDSELVGALAALDQPPSPDGTVREASAAQRTHRARMRGRLSELGLDCSEFDDDDLDRLDEADLSELEGALIDCPDDEDEEDEDDDDADGDADGDLDEPSEELDADLDEDAEDSDAHLLLEVAEEGWARLRKAGMDGLVAGVTGWQATWMDDPLFAKAFLMSLPRLDRVGHSLRLLIGEPALRQAVATLQARGWLDDEQAAATIAGEALATLPG